MAQKVVEYAATGRRKEAVARIKLALGVGKATVNGQSLQDYFKTETMSTFVVAPLVLTDTLKKYDVVAKVSGGGLRGQAGAIRHGLARALVLADEATKEALKGNGFLTRDPRMKERKKTGQPGARRRFQFSKR
ncbi:MAG: 30S ribosomal protein S9 [Kiritimatiellae bacterium]|nr:30S ribosomal protein S9 [Kiritimatiellia bacterium]MDD4735479.1 30S ribosomal protein S9 [Kiritimatiellia bacterium]